MGATLFFPTPRVIARHDSAEAISKVEIQKLKVKNQNTKVLEKGGYIVFQS